MKNKLKKLTDNAHFPLYACTAILVISTLLTAFFLGMFLEGRISEAKNGLIAAHADTVKVSVEEDEEKYVLREYSGRIGVFEGDALTPCEVLDVYVFTLPAADRSALKVGIAVYGSDALRALIEDFTG